MVLEMSSFGWKVGRTVGFVGVVVVVVVVRVEEEVDGGRMVEGAVERAGRAVAMVVSTMPSARIQRDRRTSVSVARRFGSTVSIRWINEHTSNK